MHLFEVRHKMTPREQWLEDLLEWPMIGLTFILLILFIVPLLYPLSSELREAIWVADICIWATFYVEFFLKLAVSSNYKATLLRNWWLVLILISPLLLSLRFLRLARLVSVIRIFRLQSAIKHLRKNVQVLIYNVEYVFLVLAIFTFISAFLMWRIETVGEGTITNFTDALWWSVVTITTIGYGDIVPSSAGGKVLGSIVGVLGATVFTVMIARITAIYVQSEQIKRLERRLKRPKK